MGPDQGDGGSMVGQRRIPEEPMVRVFSGFCDNIPSSYSFLCIITVDRSQFGYIMYVYSDYMWVSDYWTNVLGL